MKIPKFSLSQKKVANAEKNQAITLLVPKFW